MLVVSQHRTASQFHLIETVWWLGEGRRLERGRDPMGVGKGGCFEVVIRAGVVVGTLGGDGSLIK